VNVSINIIVAIAGICLIDLCYIFVVHTQQDATHRNKKQRHTFFRFRFGSQVKEWETTTLLGPSERAISITGPVPVL
jgi:hypothetical protein